MGSRGVAEAAVEFFAKPCSSNQRTIDPVNAHLISEHIISTKPGYK